jgi:hypothetical protein
MITAKNGTEGTMYKLVCSMPDVAYRALSNSRMSVGHPDTKEHWVRYNFMCLQDPAPGKPNKTISSPIFCPPPLPFDPSTVQN